MFLLLFADLIFLTHDAKQKFALLNSILNLDQIPNGFMFTIHAHYIVYVIMVL